MPLFANFMDTYQLGRKLADVLADEDGEAARKAIGRLTRLDPDAVRRLEPLSPGNPRFRRLAGDAAGWEQLLWVPPSLPYLVPGGVFADPAIESMTKKLVFGRGRRRRQRWRRCSATTPIAGSRRPRPRRRPGPRAWSRSGPSVR
ncbi:hypothetical protein GS444_24285 [Rhodococcus hoagii]|nr:hypothetical protein [Prescottella equi]